MGATAAPPCHGASWSVSLNIAAVFFLASLAPCCADPAPVIHYAPVENLVRSYLDGTQLAEREPAKVFRAPSHRELERGRDRAGGRTRITAGRGIAREEQGAGNAAQ
jgi:hypothetical protein